VRWPDPSASLLPDPWSLSNDLSGDSQTSDVPRVLSDATPENLWIPGAQYAGEPHGMHWHPQQHWKRISPEARKVFDAVGLGKTGKLPSQTYPKKVPPGTGEAVGHWFDKPHKDYNEAVGELFQRYLSERKSDQSK